MADVPYINVQSLADHVSMNSKAKEEAWSRQVELSANTRSLVAALTGGPNSMKPFYIKQELQKTAGDTVNFQVLEPLGGPEIVGETTKIEGKESRLLHSSYNLRLEIIRKAVQLGYKFRNFTVIGSQGDSVARKLLSEWLAGYMTFRMLYQLREDKVAANTVRPNGRATRDALLGTDVLDTATLQMAKLVAQQNGATPANIVQAKNMNEIHQYLALGTKTGLTSLKNSPDYRQGLREAQVRGDSNPLFTGGYSDWDGLGILEWEPVLHATNGPVGAPILPVAYLGVAISAGTAATPVVGGGAAYSASDDPQPYYFQNFSNYGLTEYEDVSPSPSSTTRYGIIVDPAQSGKYMVFSYQTNSKHQLVMLQRLGASASGAQVTSLAGINWNATYHTNSAAVGSKIYEITGDGITFGGTYLLGAMAGCMAYGQDRNKRFTYEDNPPLGYAIGLMSVFGMKTPKRKDLLPPNYVYIEHAVEHPGLPADLKVHNP